MRRNSPSILTAAHPALLAALSYLTASNLCNVPVGRDPSPPCVVCAIVVQPVPWFTHAPDVLASDHTLDLVLPLPDGSYISTLKLYDISVGGSNTDFIFPYVEDGTNLGVLSLDELFNLMDKLIDMKGRI